MKRRADAEPASLPDASCAVGDGVPDCATGPLGRLQFVARELAQAFQELSSAIRRKKDSR